MTRERFVEICIKEGVPGDVADRLWDRLPGRIRVNREMLKEHDVKMASRYALYHLSPKTLN